MQLNPTNFNRFLNGLAQNITWARGTRCPCYSPSSYQADPYCTNCNGIGRFWSAPVSCKVALAGQKVQRMWANFGQAEEGDVVVTIQSDSAAYAAGEEDRVVFLDSHHRFNRIMTKGEQQDRLSFVPTLIDRCFWLDESYDPVEGGIPAVAADGTMSWTAGAPPEGQQFAITGERNPEYFVWNEFVQDRAHHAGADLPRRVVLRNFDTMNRGIK